MAQSNGVNRRIVLNSRPVGAPTAENFQLVEGEVPIAAAGQVLMRTLFLSLDPYMRGRMSDAPSYAKPVAVGDVLVGGTVARVAASQHADYRVAGQIARLKGCRVVGVAGDAAKCDFVVEEYGFAACIDRRSANLREQLAAACPNGIDVYFENVGGAVFDAVLPLLNVKARVPVCGLIAHYNDTTLPPGPDRLGLLTRTLLTRRIKMQGFIIFEDYSERYGEFFSQMSTWIKGGKVKFREDIVEGLENAPPAFIGLLEGRNFGKLIVRVSSD